MMNWKGFGKNRSWPNFKVLSRHSPGGNNSAKILTQDSRCPGLDLNPVSPEYNAGVLRTCV
jgi:hypothetical protein